MSPTDALETDRGGISAPFSSSKGSASFKGRGKIGNYDDNISPILRSSIDPGLGLELGEPSVTHIMAVDRLANILQPSAPPQSNTNIEMSDSEDSSS